MGLSLETLGAANAYTKETVEGAGAIKGQNCTIQSITEITGGHRVTFAWTNNSGVSQTSTMDVMDGAKGDKGAKGDNGANGADGQDGEYTYDSSNLTTLSSAAVNAEWYENCTKKSETWKEDSAFYYHILRSEVDRTKEHFGLYYKYHGPSSSAKLDVDHPELFTHASVYVQSIKDCFEGNRLVPVVGQYGLNEDNWLFGAFMLSQSTGTDLVDMIVKLPKNAIKY